MRIKFDNDADNYFVGNGNWFYGIFGAGNNGLWYADVPTAHSIRDTTYTSTTSWHNVVFEFSSTGAMGLFVDGVSKGTATGGTGVPTSSEFLNIGGFQEGTRADIFAPSYFNRMAIFDSIVDPANFDGWGMGSTF